MRRVLAAGGVILSGLVALLALYTLRPVGLSDRLPVAHVLAMKGLLALALLVIGLLMVAIGGLGLRLRAETAPRLRHLAVLVLGGVTALAGAGHGVTLMDRGLRGGEVTAAEEPATAGSFTVLTLNTLGGRATAEEVVALAVRTGADVLALPETPAPLAAEIRDRLVEATGVTYEAWTAGTGAIGSTSMLVSARLGPYEQLPTALPGGFGRVHLEPLGEDPDQPVLVAVHPVPPVSQNMVRWRTENRALVGLCERATRPTVIAGDLNMTVDHGVLQPLTTSDAQCRDAGLEADIGGIGTWPTSLPAWAGTVIDHVLVAGGLHGTAGEVADVGESDHRAVVVRLELYAPESVSRR